MKVAPRNANHAANIVLFAVTLIIALNAKRHFYLGAQVNASVVKAVTLIKVEKYAYVVNPDSNIARELVCAHLSHATRKVNSSKRQLANVNLVVSTAKNVATDNSVLNAKHKRCQMAEEVVSLAEMAASLTPKVKVVSVVELDVPSVIV